MGKLFINQNETLYSLALTSVGAIKLNRHKWVPGVTFV